MFDSPLLASKGFAQLVYSSTHQNVNLYTDLGNPDFPISALILIEDTAVITTLDFGNLNPLSRVRVVNYGHILGAGGDGGNGAWWDPETQGLIFQAGDGDAGGPAINATCDIEVVLLEGNLWGGGGGGGGDSILGGDDRGAGGSGGVSGGQGGTGTPAGDDATSGINAVPGTANAAGGSWGEAGTPGDPSGPYGRGIGGAPGKAIELNGNSASFLVSDEATLRSQGWIIGDVS